MPKVLFIASLILVLLVRRPSARSSKFVYSYIWKLLIKTNPILGPFSSVTFDYTNGTPKYIPLWDMQNPRYKQCFKTGFPVNFDLISVFPPATPIMLEKQDLWSVDSTTNLGLIEYIINTDPDWVRKEQEMPRYFFPNVVNVHRYLHLLRSTGSIIPFLMDYEETMFVYTYVVCRKVGINDRDGICPDLCGHTSDVCGDILYAVSRTCSIIDEGVLENQFQCRCLFGYTWDMNRKKCRKKDKNINCNWLEEKKYCAAGKTKKCIEGTDSPFPTCHCEEGYHGDDCSLKISRCFETSSDNKWPSGYEACRVLEGGECENISPKDYKCNCPDKFEHDKSLLFPNCLKVKEIDECTLHTCLNNGVCVKKTELITLCVCLPGYMGLYCQFPLGTWTTWTHWSRCHPVCGPKRLKYQFRDCLGDLTCSGSMIKRVPCEPVPCLSYQRKYPLNLSVVLHSVFKIDSHYNPMIWMLKYSSSALSIEILIILVIGGTIVAGTWIKFIFHQTIDSISLRFRKFWHNLFHKNEPFIDLKA